jgi:hypothetical protein
VGGILGCSLAYVYFSNRQPKPGQKVIVFPEDGRSYTGPWRGRDGDDMIIGNKVFDPDDIEMAGPLRTAGGRQNPYSYVDLTSGFVHPEVLSKLVKDSKLKNLVKGNNRDGYSRRKKWKGG